MPNIKKMKEQEFEILLQKSESSNLDFKRSQYEISKDVDNINVSKFVKDIISFSNTIRTETAYIVIGVAINEDGTKELLGLDKNVDDSIFQEKLKNKVFPIPNFLYYTVHYNEKAFGLIEIPIKKYSEPISPTIKLKGLEPGKIYFRRGSANSEATGREIIMINKWLESLPDELDKNSLSSEISLILSDITSMKFPLSKSLTDILKVADKYNLVDLKEYCKNELTGWWDKTNGDNEFKMLSYRTTDVVVSPYEVEINPYHNLDSVGMIRELLKLDGFYQKRFLFPQPVSELEKIRNRIYENPNTTLAVLKTPASKIFENGQFDNVTLRIYVNRDNIENIYNGIRQEMIDKLLK